MVQFKPGLLISSPALSTIGPWRLKNLSNDFWNRLISKPCCLSRNESPRMISCALPNPVPIPLFILRYDFNPDFNYYFDPDYDYHSDYDSKSNSKFNYDSDSDPVFRIRLTLGHPRGGGRMVDATHHKVFLSFFLEDKTSVPEVSSSLAVYSSLAHFLRQV